MEVMMKSSIKFSVQVEFLLLSIFFEKGCIDCGQKTS